MRKQDLKQEVEQKRTGNKTEPREPVSFTSARKFHQIGGHYELRTKEVGGEERSRRKEAGGREGKGDSLVVASTDDLKPSQSVTNGQDEYTAVFELKRNPE